MKSADSAVMPILLIDDQPADVEFLRFKMRKFFHNHVEHLNTHLEARACSSAMRQKCETPALLLIAVRIPGTLSNDLLQELRKDFGTNLPICVISSYADDDLARQASESGALLLFKPFSELAFQNWASKLHTSGLSWRS